MLLFFHFFLILSQPVSLHHCLLHPRPLSPLRNPAPLDHLFQRSTCSSDLGVSHRSPLYYIQGSRSALPRSNAENINSLSPPPLSHPDPSDQHPSSLILSSAISWICGPCILPSSCLLLLHLLVLPTQKPSSLLRLLRKLFTTPNILLSCFSLLQSLFTRHLRKRFTRPTWGPRTVHINSHDAFQDTRPSRCPSGGCQRGTEVQAHCY